MAKYIPTYPHPLYLTKTGNTRWDKLGYDSFDQSNYFTCKGYSKFVVCKGHVTSKRDATGKRQLRNTNTHRITVYAKTLREAKDKACAARGWDLEEVAEIYRV